MALKRLKIVRRDWSGQAWSLNLASVRSNSEPARVIFVNQNLPVNNYSALCQLEPNSVKFLAVTTFSRVATGGIACKMRQQAVLS